jgi:hypothetical protein
LHLLQSLIAHPHHQYAESTLALTAAPFDESVVKLIDYRQMADTTLLHLARMHDMKLGHVRSGCCSHLSREQKSSITHAVNLDFHVGDFGWACCNYP